MWVTIGMSLHFNSSLLYTSLNAGVAPCIFNGRGLLQDKIGLMPKKRKLTVVVGEPISVEKNKNPSREEIDKIHRKYVMQLKNLYETFNQKYGDERVKLEIH